MNLQIRLGRRRRPRLEHFRLVRDGRLPAVRVLGVDLRRGLPVLGALEQGGADDVLGRVHRLMVVDVRGAVRAVVAVDRFAWSHQPFFSFPFLSSVCLLGSASRTYQSHRSRCTPSGCP